MPGDVFLPENRLQDLLEVLINEGMTIVGPRVKQNAIVYDTVKKDSDLPVGISIHQSPGEYRLEQKNHTRRFAWSNGPQALKPMVFKTEESLWKAHKDEDGNLSFEAVSLADQPVTAVLGVRSCDLAALDLMDKHFLKPPYEDPAYHARREKLFLIAMNCSHPSDTCFCVSTGDGPRAEQGFDMVMTELEQGYLLRAGNDYAQSLIDRLALQTASPDQLEEAREQNEQAIAVQTRTVPSRNLRDPLLQNLEHPQWQDVARRCLSCANCTSVCPTCFCFREQDIPSLDAYTMEHGRQWDSCFTPGHSYIHGLTIRAATDQRYRQWMVHKLGTWHDQYGRSGCVGCGRCITWCPVGIDISREATIICGEGE